MKKTTLKIARAFGYSWEGIVAAWRSEVAFRLEILASIIAIPAAIFLTQSKAERAIMIASVLLVLIAEIINTAIEATINRISKEIHPLSKIAKDTASGGVLLAIVLAAVVWAVVMWP